ncbi:QRFP-like peptide receptor [Ylistrum balloti]|uniref:QRFP-like peptide receptor n=1 Tax=Ylistrum balloti TaxID=509963 RepID=UPI002905D6F3|nr:QRFP-like peptide receptor [Ylistrum balloti]
MDQLTELRSYKSLFRNTNFSRYFITPYNFTGAEEIFQEFTSNLYTVHEYSTVILLTLYVPIFMVGLCGNILIIISSVRESKLKKTKNFFLANLALADLAVTLFCMPTSVGTIVYRLWIYGRFLCKSTAFLQGVSVAVSIFSLTAMSVDRYVSIQHPVAARRIMSSSQALLIIGCMWVISAIFMGPLLYIRDVSVVEMPTLPPLTFCIEDWPQDRDREAYGLFLLFVVFLIPAGTLAICYVNVGRTLCTNEISREGSDSSTRGLFSRKRAARMLIILVIVFMVCWLPYNIASLFSDMTEGSQLLYIIFFSLWLGHAHSAINPVMFWLLNRRFRERVRGIMRYVQNSSCGSAAAHSLPEYV